MTMVIKVMQKCFVCGEETRRRVLGSTISMGSPDLDLRPPKMKRITMGLWIQRCPHCGYVSEDLSDDTSVGKDWLASNEYKTCDGIKFESDLAAGFYQRHMIGLADKKTGDAFYALLHSAWACDDAKDEENAIRCRKLALPLIERLIGECDAERAETLKALKADLLRRALLFDSLIEEYAGQTFSSEILNKVVSFQLERARRQDAGCYTVKDAAEAP